MRNYYIIIVTIGLAFFLATCDTQKNKSNKSDFPILKGPYLGQKPPGITPEIFGPNIISKNMHVANISFSQDEKELFFRIMSHNHSFMVIVSMKQENGVWSKPEVLPFSGKYKDGEPFLSLDGKKLFFMSNRPLEGQTETKDYDIWISERKADGWSSPINLGSKINSDKNEACPSVSRNGTLYFNSNYNVGKGSNDIYKSELINGEYTQAKNLGDEINTSYNECNPFIAPDESYIIFNRYGSNTGSGLYISFKKDDGTWYPAIDMKEKIDIEKYEPMHGFVSPDSKYLFFTSSKNPYFPLPDQNLRYDEIVEIFNSPLNGSYNIHWVDAKFIEDLKPFKFLE